MSSKKEQSNLPVIRLKRRHFRIRKKVAGTAQRPRLSVHKSNKYITAQVIDDSAAKTLVYVTSLEKDFKNRGKNLESAKEVGALIARRAQEKGLKRVVFDRGGFKYHGVIAAVAQSARENGLEL